MAVMIDEELPGINVVHVESVMVQDDVERVGRNGSIIKVKG
jgi:hypothetical protein